MKILEYLEQIACSTSQDALKIPTIDLPESIQNALAAKDAALFKELIGNGQPQADMVRVF